MRRLSDTFYNKSTFSNCVLASLLSVGFFGLILIPNTESFAVSGLINNFSFESSFGYSYQEVLAFFKARRLGAISKFKLFTISIDLIYALIYTLMCSMWLSFFWGPLQEKLSYSYLINLMPFVVLTFNMIEHGFIYAMTEIYLKQQTILVEHVAYSSWFSMFKWTASGAVLILTLGGLLMRWQNKSFKTEAVYFT